MGLKDLVAQKAALTEEAIENLIADYVRYDTDEMDVAFTPEFANLNNRAKILVYLVALQGWPFVTDEAIANAAKPAEISDALGIPGGTLRPILKGLKDGHLIVSKNGAYSVRASHLSVVETEIKAPKTKATSAGAKRKKATKKSPNKSKQTSGSKKKNSGLNETISDWIDEGFFDDGRTTGDVRDRFHEEAVIVPHSSIPGYVNKAVRDKKLTRKKEDVDGKLVWIYRTKK